MKTLGLIGGTSWHSTADYYKVINQTVNAKLGGVASAKLFMYSVNFAEFSKMGAEGDWKGVSNILCTAAKKLEQAGAEAIVICANTPHKLAAEVTATVQIPLIHIAEITAKDIVANNVKKVALLGTKVTMEEAFYKDILAKHGIETIIPADDERAFIQHSIYNEMGKGIFSASTKERYIGIIKNLVSHGAEGVIYGCTEIPLLLKQEDCPVIAFDTLVLHATAAAEFALSNEK